MSVFNKRWDDAPAATGSGAACPYHGHLGIVDANCGWCPKPAPPASQPTVTLEKRLEKEVGFRIDSRGIRHFSLTGDPYEAEATASEIKLWNAALALLRAAEDKK